MTNEEKAKEMADSKYSYDVNSDNCEFYDCYDSALQMAEWKDEQHKAEKQQWIDDACEWLKDMACYYSYWEYNGDTYEKEIVVDTEKMIDDFKQAMED